MNKPQIGDIGFVHGHSLIDRTIEFFDNGLFNHTFVYLNNDKIVESQYFVNTRIIDNPYKDSELIILHLNLTDEQQKKLIQVVPTYLKDKYDLLQIFGIFIHDILNIPTNVTWNNKHRLICSELCVDVLHSIGYISDEDFKFLVNTTPNKLFIYLFNRLKQVS